MVQAREEKGVGARLDVILTEAELAAIENNREITEARLQNGKDALLRLTGRQTNVLPALPSNFTFPPLPEQAAFMRDVMRNNLELRNTRKNLDANESREKAAATGFFPKLTASSEYEKLNTGDSTSQFAIQFSMPLFSGGGIPAQMRFATAQRLAYAEFLRSSKQQLRQNVLNLYHQAETIRQRKKILQTEIANRRAVLAKTKLAWREGIGVAQQIIDAEQALFASHRTLSGLYYQYLNLMAQLQHLNGGINNVFLDQLDGYFLQAPVLNQTEERDRDSRDEKR